ncbi:MAG: PQQ-binding-like beta-propeller repeat protein [Bryobacterales bacterium]|nr:PQQ-binding-like beta-propeller repeat protein [Bryobacterales bacterium]
MRLVLILLPVFAWASADWPYYGGDAGSSKYSRLDQINRRNVGSLRPLWTFDLGDQSDGTKSPSRSALEVTPLVVDGVMYVTTPFHRLFALDAETGRQIWVYDPKFRPDQRVNLYINRGMAFWRSGGEKRIFYGDQEGRLFSVDTATGKADPRFGKNGAVDLKIGLMAPYPEGQLGLTSPPAVCGDVVITGSWVSDGEPRGPSGDLRGFDARTGRQLWRFHTVPHRGEFGYDTWQPGSAEGRGGTNAWSLMSVDPQRGMIFAPLTSPSVDFYGGDRKGDNLFGDSVVALDCRTGARKWHFQTVHHNLWDYDLPSAPVLVTVHHNGKDIPAVAQATKTGFVFVLNRETGKPLFPVEERPVPKSTIPGEQSSPTQPFPLKPPPFARQSMTPADLTTVTPDSRTECGEMIRDTILDTKIFDPIGEQQRVMFPGTNGGSNWGGGSFDPATHMFYVNSMDVASLLRLVKRPAGSTVPFRNQGFGRFWDKSGYPCQQPPWGSLTAFDLDRGEIRWRSVLGEFPELTRQGIPKTGAPNLGGSLVTAGGLLFIGATNDSRFRAFDKSTGAELWTVELPASAHATPMTYEGPLSGRQLVAIASGGGNKYNKTFASKLIVYALPRSGDPTAPREWKAVPPVAVGAYLGVDEKLPQSVAPQPVPFSHRVHATAARLSCTDCHIAALSGDRAGMPSTTRCMACHRAIAASSPSIQTLKQYAAGGTPIPWVPIYKLPDFVFFSHQRHAAAKVGCGQCHGPVAQHDVLEKEVSTSMNTCYGCHVKSKASTSCDACHMLGQ